MTEDNANTARAGGVGWRSALGVGLFLVSALLLAVPLLTSGADSWLGIDWIDGRKLYSIDDAYRYFVAKNAFLFETVFLWNYVLPLALSFDTAIAAVTDGSLLLMRICHAGVGALTLWLIARAGLKAGCGPVLALASVLIVGLMPLYLIISSSFYGEGLFAFLMALAFVLLIEERLTPLALVVGLSPLVRPEGIVWCALFLGYFGMRRDVARCALIALPGFAYIAAMLALFPDWSTSMSWRLELRQILTPLDLGDVQALSLSRLLNPVWGGLALGSLLMARYRKWWPMLAAPACIVAIQAVGIVRGVQDYELRYFFALVPIFGIAWAFPIRHLLDANAALPRRRRVIASVTAMGFGAVVAGHLLQSDWVRQFVDDPSARWLSTVARHDAGREFANRALLFDPKPLRAFARRLDAYLAARPEIRTVFVADPPPLYFLELVRDDARRELVLIPHDAAITAYSGGFFFGFSLQHLTHRYYRFAAVEDAPAVLIVNDDSPNQFFFQQEEAQDGAATNSRSSRQGVAAKIQSGSLKAFGVLPTVRDEVVWSIPRRADAQ